MTSAITARLEESQPAMRMWKFFDRLALLSVLEHFDPKTFPLFEADESGEQHHHLLGLLRDVHVDHRKLDDEKSQARLKHVDSWLNDKAREERAKPNYRGVVHRKNPETGKLEAHPETEEEHTRRFRMRGFQGRRSGESEEAFKKRQERWHAGHRGEGMDAKSVDSARELMSHPEIEEHLKSQRSRAIDTSDLPSRIQKERLSKKKVVRTQTGETKKKLVTRPAPFHQPEMKMAERDYLDNVPSKHKKRYLSLSKADKRVIRDHKKVGNDKAAEEHEQKIRADLERKWREDHTDAEGRRVPANYKRAYADDHHGGGALKHQAAKIKKGKKEDVEQPPEGGWSPDNPHPDSHLGKMKRHQESKSKHAQRTGKGSEVSEPGDAGSAAMNAIKAGLLTGHGDYHHFYEPHQLKRAKERLDARKKHIDDEQEATGKRVKVPSHVAHPHSYANIEQETGVSTQHLINMHHGVETVPIRDIAHQIRRKSDSDYEHYIPPAKRKKPEKVAADAPTDDDDDEEKPDAPKHGEHHDIDFDKLTPSSVGRVMARTVGKRARTGKDVKKSDEVARWSGLAASGEAGDSEGIAGLATRLGKQEERKRVSVAKHTDAFLKHPGDKPTKASGESQEDFDKRVKADREHHEELTRHVYPDDSSKRKSSVKLGAAAKTLLHPRGSLYKEIEERTRKHKAGEEGAEDSHKGISHKIPVEDQVKHHAARLLKTDVNTVDTLASTGRTGTAITRGARSSKDAPSGAASGMSHGEPLGAMLRKERETQRAGEKPSDKSRRPRALVHEPKGSGREDYTRAREIHDTFDDVLHHVFPKDREKLATGGEGGKAHHSTTRDAHPAALRKKEEGKAGAWGSPTSLPSGFRLGDHKPISHEDFDEEAHRKGPKRPPKVRKSKERSQEEVDAENARRKKQYDEEKATHKADPDAYVESKRKEHASKVDAWHDHLAKMHGHVHEIFRGDGKEGRLKGIFTRHLDKEDEHTKNYHRDLAAETPGERARRKREEKLGRVEHKSLLNHHLKVASADPRVHDMLGVTGSDKAKKKQTSQALSNLLRRMETHGHQLMSTAMHGKGGVGETISRTPLSSQKRREKMYQRGKRPVHPGTLVSQLIATHEKRSAEAQEKLKKQQATGETEKGEKVSTPAKSFAQKVRATDIVPMAGTGQKATRPGTMSAPSTQQKPTMRLPAHPGEIGRRRQSGEEVKVKIPGGKPKAVPGEQLPSKRTRAARERALPSGTKLSVTAREGQSAGRFRRPKPEPSEQEKRSEKESEHQIHLQKVKKHSSHVQNFIGSRDALDTALERHGSFDHPAVKKAQASHEKHKAKLKELEIDPGKVGAAGPSEVRKAREERRVEKRRRGEDEPGQARVTGPIPGRVRVKAPSPELRTAAKEAERRKAEKREQEKTKRQEKPKRSFETPPAFKQAAETARRKENERKFDYLMGKKPEQPKKKLFVPTPAQRQRAVLHRTPLGATPSGGSKKPIEPPKPALAPKPPRLARAPKPAPAPKPESAQRQGSQRAERGRPGEQPGNFERSEGGEVKKAEESLSRTSLSLFETRRPTSFFEKVRALA